MKRTLLLAICLVLFSSKVSATEGIENVCPLTKKYMLENLYAMTSMIDSNQYTYPKKYHEHMLRMAGEVLKSEDFSELKSEIKKGNKSCSYFWISVHMGVDEYPDFAKKEELQKLKINVEKCINWVTANISDDKETINSTFCE